MITVTMDGYGHMLPHIEEAVTDKMDEAYREAQTVGSEALIANGSQEDLGLSTEKVISTTETGSDQEQ